MPAATVELTDIARRLVDRGARGRTEATVQSDVRLVLLAAQLNLTEHDVLDVHLEAQVGDRRRIDIEMGRCVIEVKKDLRVSSVLEDAAEQLAGYVAERTAQDGHRYTGIVTRRIVGWQASRSLKTDLALHALEQAIWNQPTTPERDTSSLSTPVGTQSSGAGVTAGWRSQPSRSGWRRLG